MVALVEVDLDELAKATTVVVAQRLSVSECLQDRVRLLHASRIKGWCGLDFPGSGMPGGGPNEWRLWPTVWVTELGMCMQGFYIFLALTARQSVTILHTIQPSAQIPRLPTSPTQHPASLQF